MEKDEARGVRFRRSGREEGGRERRGWFVNAHQASPRRGKRVAGETCNGPGNIGAVCGARVALLVIDWSYLPSSFRDPLFAEARGVPAFFLASEERVSPFAEHEMLAAFRIFRICEKEVKLKKKKRKKEIVQRIILDV